MTTIASMAIPVGGAIMERVYLLFVCVSHGASISVPIDVCYPGRVEFRK